MRYRYICFRCRREFKSKAALGGHRKYCNKRELINIVPDADKSTTYIYLQRIKDLEQKLKEKEKEKKRTWLLHTGEIVEMTDSEILQYKTQQMAKAKESGN